jgi:hypothetical protein
MALASCSDANQVELAMHVVTRVRFQAGGGQAAIDQVEAVLDLVRLAFDDADQGPSSSAVAKLAMGRLNSDQMTSVGLP